MLAAQHNHQFAAGRQPIAYFPNSLKHIVWFLFIYFGQRVDPSRMRLKIQFVVVKLDVLRRVDDSLRPVPCTLAIGHGSLIRNRQDDDPGVIELCTFGAHEIALPMFLFHFTDHYPPD